ncbi:MAG: membrane protein insertase YidC, partial [Alistipes sp.]|nr:membrane protein insertase YidC [Alistipes sp.]
LIAPENFSAAALSFETFQPGTGYMKRFRARLSVPYAPQTETYDFAFYFGPNKYSILKKVAVGESGEELALERLIPLGWGIFGWINRWCVIPVFDLLRNYIGSFGVIILILAVLIRLIISPLTYKSYVSMAKMRLVKPEVDELAKKYPKQEDAMKRQQATMELYRKAGINPMGGCIPMLIQFPILIAMFRFFPAAIELRDQAFLWADDLSSYDSILDLPFSIPFYGDHISLFALLMALSTFAFSYINYQQTASSQPQMAGMKFMMVYMMPVMLLLWFNSYSSGLCWYYLLSNLLTIGQTFAIRRMVDDTKIRAIMEANAARKSNGKKSKFQQRYEEIMRQQEAAQRAKRK